MVGFLVRHPIFTLSVVGSLIGTILSYIAPHFTRDYLCADEDFTIGNLGISVFVHNGFAHYVGNLFFMIPGALLCEAFYNNGVVLAAILIFSFVDSMLCIPMKRATCGYSGVQYMLCSMACVWGFHWWGFTILGILVLASVTLDKGEKTDVFAHVFGFITGGVLGSLLQIFG